MPPRWDRTTVRLVGIALRHQGSHDSLCAYYAGAMLLSALRPEIDERFEAARVADDPLFANLPRPRRRSVEQAVAEWLTSGVRLPHLCRALSAAAGPGTRFRYRRSAWDDEALALLRARVDLGLPSLLGWDSREMGAHTVLVVGYERYAKSPRHWLRLLDPIRSVDALEWGQIAQLATGPAEIIWCAAHDGVRPDKLTVERDAHAMPLPGRSRIDRWDPARGEFSSVATR